MENSDQRKLIIEIKFDERIVDVKLCQKGLKCKF